MLLSSAACILSGIQSTHTFHYGKGHHQKFQLARGPRWMVLSSKLLLDLLRQEAELNEQTAKIA